jgi:hypothetical protein
MKCAWDDHKCGAVIIKPKRMNSVNTSKDSLQRRSVPLSVVTSIERDCSEQGDMTELTPILNSVHTPNDSLQRRRVPFGGYQERKSM